MEKKAQGVTEYLIILAVVIIIALIVVGVMGGIPGMGKSAEETKARVDCLDAIAVSYCEDNNMTFSDSWTENFYCNTGRSRTDEGTRIQYYFLDEEIKACEDIAKKVIKK